LITAASFMTTAPLVTKHHLWQLLRWHRSARSVFLNQSPRTQMSRRKALDESASTRGK